MVFNRTKQVAYHFPSRASEWFGAIVLLNWGLMIYWSDGAVLHACSDMLSIMNETSWYAAFIALGTLRIALLIINGTLRRSPHFRSIASFLSCFAWFQITLAFVNSSPVSTALSVYPVLLALDFYNTYRTLVEARILDEGYKNAGST